MKFIKFSLVLLSGFFVIYLYFSSTTLFGHDFSQRNYHSISNLTNKNISLQTQQQPTSTPSTVTPTPSQTKAPNNDNKIIICTLIIIYCLIVGFTCYKKHQNELIIFSSFTDVAVTFTLFGIIIAFMFLFRSEKTIIAIIATVIVGLLSVFLIFIYIMSTFKYNSSIIYSLLATFTKFSVSLVFIILLIASQARRDRRKGERRDYYERSVRRENRAKALFLIGLYTTFLYFSTTEKSFIPLKKYIRGEY